MCFYSNVFHVGLHWFSRDEGIVFSVGTFMSVGPDMCLMLQSIHPAVKAQTLYQFCLIGKEIELFWGNGDI